MQKETPVVFLTKRQVLSGDLPGNPLVESFNLSRADRRTGKTVSQGRGCRVSCVQMVCLVEVSRGGRPVTSGDASGGLGSSVRNLPSPLSAEGETEEGRPETPVWDGPFPGSKEWRRFMS